MKICNVCGLSVDNYTDECPNCDSFSFKELNGRFGELEEEKIKLRRYK